MYIVNLAKLYNTLDKFNHILYHESEFSTKIIIEAVYDNKSCTIKIDLCEKDDGTNYITDITKYYGVDADFEEDVRSALLKTLWCRTNSRIKINHDAKPLDICKDEDINAFIDAIMFGPYEPTAIS
jgi:hypothetical protein